MHITFLGAAQEVTGSLHVVTTSTGSLLVDCGLFQGRRLEANERNRKVPKEAVVATAMVLTHAHIDHSGNIPTLVRSGFHGPIYATSATVDLARALLLDSARIQEADAEYLNRTNANDPDFELVVPLYTEEDALAAVEHLRPVPYGHTFEPVPGIRATFLEAGHILGSAQVMLELAEGASTRRVLFTGDLGRKGLPVVRDPAVPKEQPDVVVIESTYGNRLHKDIAASDEELAQVICETVKRKGRVIVPAFAVGRTQELVFALNRLERAGKIPRLPVYVDSPLSTEVTKIFEKHAECFDEEILRFLRNEGNPFGFDRLTYVTSREESKRLNDLDEPAVIIASSGMCEAGRILHHLRHSVESERNTIVIVGFQAEHTLGRRLVERRPKVKILGREYELHAGVVTLGAFSAHADQQELLEYAKAVSPRESFYIVHGEPEAAKGLQEVLTANGLRGHIPCRGMTVSLS